MHDVVNAGVMVHRSAIIGTLLVEATSGLEKIVHFRSYEHDKRERECV
jgi:hypothetical protein